MGSLLRYFAGVVLLGITAAPSWAENHYYVVIYGSQPPGRPVPQLSHSFATFVRADLDPAKDGGGKVVERFTISWLPADEKVKLLERAVAGKNLTLEESMEWAEANKLQTLAQGPFEIDEDLFRHAKAQLRKLQSGTVAYKAIDRRTRSVAYNCIHALTDLYPGWMITTGTARGEEASEQIANLYRPRMLAPEKTHPWVFAHVRESGKPLVARPVGGDSPKGPPVMSVSREER